MTRQASEAVLDAFAPIGAKDARLMILGSMPGAASLADTEYYAHPRNAFWPIMQALFGGSINSYEKKQQILTNNQIVVWDVLTQCIRPGSLDSNIRKDSVVCNNFASFLNRQPNISQIAFNGKASEQLFRKHVLSELKMHFTNRKDEKPQQQQGKIDQTTISTIQLISLPSTSPAMASLNVNEKILAWRTALLQGVKDHPTADIRV